MHKVICTTKKDIEGTIVGLDQYKPGDASVKDLTLKVSGGTSGVLTVVVEQNAVERKKRHYTDKAHALIRLGGQRTSALSGTNLLLRYASHTRVLAIDAKDLRHPAIGHALAGFAPTELYSIPLSFLRTVMYTLRLHDMSWAFRRVRYILYSGEWTSAKEKEEILKDFPKLEESVDEYGSAEAGPYAVSCKHLSKKYEKEGLLVFHPHESVGLWIDGDKGGGEIIISTNELKNYRTGDKGELREEKCECGEKKTLIFHGRINTDYVDCAGAIFSIKDLEHVFNYLSDIVSDYQIIVREHIENKTPKGSVHIKFVPTRAYKNHSDVTTYVTEFVHKHLAVTPTRTLGELVEQKIFTPTTAEIVSSISKKTDKRERIKKEI